MANTPFSGLELNINVRPWETETSDVRETTNKNLLENFNSHSGDSNGKEIYEITPKNGESLEPCIGMDFKSLEDAKEFYEEYGMRTGFTIRNGHVRRSRKDNSIIGRELVCTKEGYPVKKDQNPEKRVLPSRPVTREGCNATLRVAKKDVGKWVITGFIKQHSHQLNPGKIRPPQGKPSPGYNDLRREEALMSAPEPSKDYIIDSNTVFADKRKMFVRFVFEC
ncbi:hypothetical protein GIB67_042934 [Kingdonia uniflora]|uniref:FAR1 domain-containing protein n=1 Tax=Kingdonia uniflora TaxID=39325 RepID=A0A7J7L652_9MAGN|nr:hypothetical protein GIB67_042934 [Kingdonia uniflora]